jgi:hypothetical protein
MHRLVAEPDNETTVYVGAENWPVPFPLAEHNGSWFFDSDLGSREIMFRRIGENEMDATEALRGIIAAENQFDAQNGEYAQHLNCSPGRHDGLFSPENGNDMDKNLRCMSSLVRQRKSTQILLPVCQFLDFSLRRSDHRLLQEVYETFHSLVLNRFQNPGVTRQILEHPEWSGPRLKDGHNWNDHG